MKNRLPDQGQRNPQVERCNCSPFAGTFLTGRIQNLLNDGFPVLILKSQDIAGNLDEVTVELFGIPLLKDFMLFESTHSQEILHQVVGFVDDLHVAILDTVVHHFDEMTSTAFSHPVAAGASVFDFGGHGLEDLLHMRPCGG